MKPIVTTILLAAFLAGGFVAIDKLAGEIPNQAKPFRAATEDGGTTGPGDFRGRVLLLNFWATFCKPCIEEMPSLGRLATKYHDRGLAILAVSIDERKSDVEAFLEAHSIGFPVALDPEKRIATSYGTEKVPETYLIDRRGIVRAVVVGAVDWQSPRMVREIEKLLDQS